MANDTHEERTEDGRYGFSDVLATALSMALAGCVYMLADGALTAAPESASVVVFIGAVCGIIGMFLRRTIVLSAGLLFGLITVTILSSNFTFVPVIEGLTVFVGYATEVLGKLLDIAMEYGGRLVDWVGEMISNLTAGSEKAS